MSKDEVVLNIIIMVLANVISKIVNDIIDKNISDIHDDFNDSQELTVLMIIILSAFGIYQLP